MKEKIIAKILPMLGKMVRYGLSEFTIVDYDFQDERERFFIYVSDRVSPFDRPYETAIEFLEEFILLDPPINSNKSEINTIPVHPNQNTTLIPSEIHPTTKKLKDILLQNIEDIKNNTNYIPQAEAINRQVGQVLNVIKTELECIRLASELQKDEA